MDLVDTTFDIWIGNSRDAKDIDALRFNGIRSVLNVAFDLSYQLPADITQVKIGLVDGPAIQEEVFALAIKTLNELYKLGPVLVHCHEGKSRSPSVVAAFLAQKLDLMTVEGAYEQLYTRRPSMDRTLDPKPALKTLAIESRKRIIIR